MIKNACTGHICLYRRFSVSLFVLLCPCQDLFPPGGSREVNDTKPNGDVLPASTRIALSDEIQQKNNSIEKSRMGMPEASKS